MRRPIFLVFLSCFICGVACAQMHSRLIATVDWENNDSVYYTYSHDRDMIMRTWSIPFSTPRRDDLYDSFAHYIPGQSSVWWKTGARIYDAANNPIVTRTYDLIIGHPIGPYVDSIVFDGNHNMVQHRFYVVTPGNMRYLSGEDYVYTSGLLTKYTEHLPHVGTNFHYYTYNNNNQLMSEAHADYDTTGLVIKDSTQALYAYSGSQLMQVLRQGFLVWIMTNLDKTDYIYNNGLLMGDSSYTWSSGQWALIGTDSNDYDSKDDMVLSVRSVFNMNGTLMQKSRSTNAYDSSHNKILAFGERFDTSAKVYEDHFIDSSTYDQLNQEVWHWSYVWNKDSSKWYENWVYHNYYEYFWPSSVSKQNSEGFELTIFPNPVQHVLQLKTGTKEKQSCTFTITDIQGRLLRQWVAAINGSEVIHVPIMDLPNGTYLLGASYPGSKLSKRFSVAN